MSSPENNALDINLDEFLPMPGSDDILTGPDTSKTTVFSKPKDLDTTFLEAKEAVKKEEDKEEDKKDELKPAELEAAKEVIADLFDETDDTPKAASGRPKVDKSGLVDTFTKLIDEGLIVPFDDEKPMDQYSINDWKELLQANFEERENKVKQEVPASFFDSLPDELQYAAKYVMDGGQDLKGLFRALSHVEEVRQLDPRDDNDQEIIARQYLRATQFGTEEEIDEEIETWKDLGNLHKKAAQFKPKLDRMQQEVVEYQLQQQEMFKQQQHEATQQFMDNVYHTLKDGHLNGVKMDKKTQAFLFTELTQPKYQSLQGRNTNLLGHLLERYQFVEPRYDLIAEALWLLADPDSYKNNLKIQAKTEATQETVRKLKTEEARKLSSTQMVEEEPQKPAKRTIPRQQNIFKR
jgi:hypothetical protein